MLRPLAEFVIGAGYLRRGAAAVFGNTRLLVLGALPAIVTTVLLFAALVTLGLYAGDVAAWATPFADGWSSGWSGTARAVIRVALAVALVGASILVAVLAFAALTLAVGGPFYDRIAEEVDGSLGGSEHGGGPWWRRLGSGARDSMALLGVSVLCGIVLVGLGFIPVFGQVVVPMLAAFVGGWLLALELTGTAFEARGLRLGDRRRALRGHRARTLGFAVPTYLLCLVPLAAIVVLPVAVAGATLLARDLLVTSAPGRGSVVWGPHC